MYTAVEACSLTALTLLIAQFLRRVISSTKSIALGVTISNNIKYVCFFAGKPSGQDSQKIFIAGRQSRVPGQCRPPEDIPAFTKPFEFTSFFFLRCGLGHI